MLLIKIEANENGTHDNNTVNSEITVPDGWAVVPQEMEAAAASLLPWVVLSAQDGVVTAITNDVDARAAWEAQPKTTPEPSPEEDRDTMLIDQEYRLTLLELGVM